MAIRQQEIELRREEIRNRQEEVRNQIFIIKSNFDFNRKN